MTTPAVAPGPVFVPRPVPDPELRLFLMHHAGGSHVVYRPWLPHLPPEWEVCLLDAPGRGRLTGQPIPSDAGELVDYLWSGIEPLTDRPVAFFGHSMGALVVYELVRGLGRRGGAPPSWVGLSGWCPRRHADGAGTHLLPTPELRRSVASLGGLPAELIEDTELWALFEPVIRADYRLVDRWAPGAGAWPRGVPVSLFGGTRDTVATPGDLDSWRHREFAHAPRPHLFEGGHFYFQGRVGEVVRWLADDLRSALASGAVT
ncbi:thioesterase II family protein [Nocardiopsis sp. FIRDI 009]|uniref:thioesterase II family protein n=1 Tax=Nocardiopsis sp. FIRDI 009 TaxID=714197 RepID=UPI000E2734D6|nr:alpha/beta fold hydrolase [Nocardiopsis sp. FIRDI 009]